MTKAKNAKSASLGSYPCLWRWLSECGATEIGHCRQMGSFIGMLDEGGLIWVSRPSFRSLDGALTDAEEGVARWTKPELGIRDAVSLGSL
jgi:hypothetical protein